MTPADGAVAFDFGGDRYTMRFDMKAIAFFEREADCSILQVMRHIALAQEDPLGHPPKLSLLAFLIQAGLRHQHPDVTLDHAARMIGDPDVQRALSLGMNAAAPKPDPSAEGNGKPCPNRKKSTGTISSAGRSRRG
ncbi:hypothetical protein [Novosphingobium olei]|uniref:hypothetical protein n=1 Tax=Novosphingobium olei TaxID=2728851 RepID=UPI0030897AD4|nr:hypothetical protein NSDW_32950 [Novosphingobium olei]